MGKAPRCHLGIQQTLFALVLGLWVAVLHLKHLHYFIISNRVFFFLLPERLLLL